MEREIQYYQTENGRKPVVEWLKKLKDRVTRSRIDRHLERLQEGYYGDYKTVDKKLWELRLNFGPGYRIYFTEHDGDIILLLCGGDKSTQTKDIATAKVYLENLKITR